MNMTGRLLVWTTLFLLVGCGSVDRMAIGTQARLMEQGSDVVLRERSWEWFRQSTPPTLQLLEGLLIQDPRNLVLRRNLVKGYAGHAWAVSETLAWEERVRDLERRPAQAEALDLYARALSHGWAYLAQKGVSKDELLRSSDEEITGLLDRQLGEDDRLALLYTGHAWGSAIQLNTGDLALVAQVPKVKAVFDWICKRWPDIERGFCPLFYAQYEVSRPKMLGGNPARGEEIFQEYFRRQPHNLLARVLRLQVAVVPSGDEEEYRAEMDKLESGLADFERLLSPTAGPNTSSFAGHPDFNLYNAIARKRFELMRANEKLLF